MVDYEKGSPAWDVGIIVTRHHVDCARLADLRRTAAIKSAGGYVTAEERLSSALTTPCSCGAGDSDAEATSRRANVS